MHRFNAPLITMNHKVLPVILVGATNFIWSMKATSDRETNVPLFPCLTGVSVFHLLEWYWSKSTFYDHNNAVDLSDVWPTKGTWTKHDGNDNMEATKQTLKSVIMSRTIAGLCVHVRNNLHTFRSRSSVDLGNKLKWSNQVLAFWIAWEIWWLAFCVSLWNWSLAYILRARFFKKIQDWILKSERIRKRIMRFSTKQINPRSFGSWCVKEPKNPLWKWILRFLWRTIIQKILDWSI